MTIPERRWYDYRGDIVTAPLDAPLTTWSRLDRMTHAILGDGAGPGMAQLLTLCGRRGCPASGHEVPGRPDVDCPRCLDALSLSRHSGRARDPRDADRDARDGVGRGSSQRPALAEAERGLTNEPDGPVAGWVAALIAKLPDVQTPAFQQRLAKREAERTDPWRWYCRLCSASGEHEDRVASREGAYAHIAEGQPCGAGRLIGASEVGRLLHVWTYGGRKAAPT